MSREGAWRVEPIRLQRGGIGPARALLRVSQHGLYVGDAATVDDLAALGVPVGDLVDEDEQR